MSTPNDTTFSIYRIFCKATGQSYVGQTNDTRQRWTQHRAALRSGKHHSNKLQQAFWKYGELVFEFEVLEEGITADNATNREAYWMKAHEGYLNGFNMSYVGHPNDKPIVPAYVRPVELIAPPLQATRRSYVVSKSPTVSSTVVKNNPIDESPALMAIRKLGEMLVELKTQRDIAEDQRDKAETENKLLIRENAVLRWRLGERNGENIRIA